MQTPTVVEVVIDCEVTVIKHYNIWAYLYHCLLQLLIILYLTTTHDSGGCSTDARGRSLIMGEGCYEFEGVMKK